MRRRIPILCLLLAFNAGGARADEATDAHFLERVRPLLESRCISCHGPEQQKGGLRLDSREAILRGGGLGPAIVPGNPGESLLLRAVLHAMPDLEMPPKERLTPEDIAVLERWVREGAAWPDAPVAREPAESDEPLGDAWSDPRNPITRLFHGQRLDLWSLRPVKRPAVPASGWKPGSSGSPPRNAIDHFIRTRLAAEGLAPSEEADRRVLARRLYFDLTGLPPSPEEMAAFLADDSPDAYERLVDRLLQSPRYGEHHARAWLDVVRYSDSNGFDWDEFRPVAWRFRDYVIRSFNQDKPFDQFIREQLAGDELLDGPPDSPEEQDLLIATGFLRIGPQDNSASLFDEQDRARSEWLADLTETTGSAFLGLSLSCCRCHDHKHDPLSQADYYRFRAFFQPVTYGDDLALDLREEQEAIREQHAAVEAMVRELINQRRALLAPVRERLREERIKSLSEEEQRLLAMNSDPQPQDFKEQAEAIAAKVEPSDADVKKALVAWQSSRLGDLNREIDALRATKRPLTRGLLATDSSGQVPPTRILFQGDHRAEREAVSPGFPSVLDPNPAVIHASLNPKTTGRRLTLANWIVSRDNPLTARVLVNRAWQAFFGRGLVATPNDFGLAGARPTHPELLDWLASELMDNGWSIKRLHRLIVTSATYRQRSSRGPCAETNPGKTGGGKGNGIDPEAVDSENTLLWRQNLRRLTAEQLRDAALAVSGLLREQPGGPPIWPELPPEVLQANPAFLDDNAEKTKGWYPSPLEERSVRSIYLVQKRTVRVPFMEAFDLPDNSVSCPVRKASIVAPQALALMNGAEPIRAARALAGRIEHEAGTSIEERVAAAFEIALQRAPTMAERKACERFLNAAGLVEMCRALLNLNEFAFVD